MVFEMPEEISGQKNSNVVCQGRVMRASDKDTPEAAKGKRRAKAKQKEETNAPEQETSSTGEGKSGLAASIVDYKFIH
jgi:hypothetical protein